MTRTPRGDFWEDSGPPQSITVHEQIGNPDHQGFIGFLPPREAEGNEVTTHKTAKRVAAELVLLPREHRGSAEYPEAYLKELSGCSSWTKLRCAYCDCFKSGKKGKKK